MDTAETGGGLGSGILRHSPRRLLVTARQIWNQCFYSSYSHLASDYLHISENGSYYGLSICQKGHSGIFADLKYQLPSVNMQGATSNMAHRSGGGAEYPCNHDTEHNLRDTSRRAARSAPPSEPRFLLLYAEYSLLNGLQLLARQNTRQYEESENCLYS